MHQSCWRLSPFRHGTHPGHETTLESIQVAAPASSLSVHGATVWHHFLSILTADRVYDGCVSVHNKVPRLHRGHGRPAGLILHTCARTAPLAELCWEFGCKSFDHRVKVRQQQLHRCFKYPTFKHAERLTHKYPLTCRKKKKMSDILPKAPVCVIEAGSLSEFYCTVTLNPP